MFPQLVFGVGPNTCNTTVHVHAATANDDNEMQLMTSAQSRVRILAHQPTLVVTHTHARTHARKHARTHTHTHTHTQITDVYRLSSSSVVQMNIAALWLGRRNKDPV